MEDCCVCYEPIICEDFIQIKECTHKMCKECMKEHVLRNMNKCPVCRIEFDINEKAYEIGIQLNTDIDDLILSLLNTTQEIDDMDFIIDTILLTQINLISLEFLSRNE